LGLGIFKSQIFKMTNLENQNNNEWCDLWIVGKV
jgi:hypothetical protein